LPTIGTEDKKDPIHFPTSKEELILFQKTNIFNKNVRNKRNTYWHRKGHRLILEDRQLVGSRFPLPILGNKTIDSRGVPKSDADLNTESL
jgi:hypothetical protein